jgi:hypothetical protein
MVQIWVQKMLGFLRVWGASGPPWRRGSRGYFLGLFGGVNYAVLSVGHKTHQNIQYLRPPPQPPNLPTRDPQFD